MDFAYKFMSKSRQYRSLIPPAEVYNDRNREVVNRDALISAKLSASPYALDMVGYCGLVTLVPFADGVLSNEIKDSVSPPLSYDARRSVTRCLDAF